jgi:hypothetical protein
MKKITQRLFHRERRGYFTEILCYNLSELRAKKLSEAKLSAIKNLELLNKSLVNMHATNIDRSEKQSTKSLSTTYKILSATPMHFEVLKSSGFHQVSKLIYF